MLSSSHMQPTSATDAIGLAFTLTRKVLLQRPFRLGRFFKIALLAAFTQASFLSVSISYPLQGSLAAARRAHPSTEQLFVAGDGISAFAGALGIGLLLAIFAILLVCTLAYLYLLCRARATLFDLVVFESVHVRPAWRRRARPARRYFGLFLLALLAFWTILAATIGPLILRIVRLSLHHANGFDTPPAVGSLMLTLVGVIWLLMPLWLATDALLQDFILPALTLNGQDSISAVFARFGHLLRQSPGQLLLFLVLRTVAAFGIALALGMALLVATGGVALSSYGVGRLLYHALWPGGLVAHTVFFAYFAGATLLVGFLYLLGITAVYGVSGTFKTSYGAHFYAGYYPELAVALYTDMEAVDPVNGQPPPPPPLPFAIW